MTTHKISLMEAYQIETLRNKGFSNEQIVEQVKTGSIASWQELHEHFDFNELLHLANQDSQAFEKILSNGYQVKFVTFNGLKNLLRLRIGKVEGKDYELEEKGIRNLTLTEEELQKIKQMLSANWVMEEINDTDGIVNIKLVTS